MSVYIALLRGINVGGKNVVRMEALRLAFEALGFLDTRTYIQSGNVVFRAARGSPSASRIEARLRADFGFEIPVVLRTSAQWSDALAKNPFIKRPVVDEGKLHAIFLSGDPTPDRLSKLLLSSGADEIRFCDGVIYLHAPSGYARTAFSNTYLEAKLRVRVTARNWATVKKLAQMAKSV